MSLGNPDYLRNEKVFGNRLNTVGEKLGLRGAAQIARALYENPECFKIIKPGGRTVKYRVNCNKDVDTISRAVQRHFDFDDCYAVPGNYMLAYHILFNCSLDYLYGIIDDPYPNAEVADICKKTGLSEKAVENLMQNPKIHLEDFLYQDYEYELLYGNIDPEGSVRASTFWSDILESDLFNELPEDWSAMACALQLSGELKGKTGTSEINKAQTIYWGCAGLFDRKISNYFHEKAEHFSIPRIRTEEEKERE